MITLNKETIAEIEKRKNLTSSLKTRLQEIADLICKTLQELDKFKPDFYNYVTKFKLKNGNTYHIYESNSTSAWFIGLESYEGNYLDVSFNSFGNVSDANITEYKQFAKDIDSILETLHNIVKKDNEEISSLYDKFNINIS